MAATTAAPGADGGEPTRLGRLSESLGGLVDSARSRLPESVHDVPGVGLVTSSCVDGFGGLIWQGMTDEQLREAFDKIDTGRRGKLDKTQLAEALRAAGKSERYVQRLVDACGEEELDFDFFKALVSPAPGTRPMTFDFYGLPVPNVEKVLDVPVIGNTLVASESLLSQSADTFLRYTCYPEASDKKLKKLFEKLDTDGSGTLDKVELAGALRGLWHTEAKIKEVLETVDHDLTLYEFKALCRGPKFSPSSLNYVPLVGPSVSTHLLSTLETHDVSEEDMREAFDHIDKGKKGKLDKTGVADVLRELGQSEQQVQKALDEMPDEEMDFEGFKAFFGKDEGRPMFKWFRWVPVPNPAKIHDVPFVGTFTSLAQDVIVDTCSSTVGSAYRAVRKLKDEELREQFDAQDADRDARLTKPEVAKAMRGLELSESEIKGVCDALEAEKVSYEEFADLVRNNGRWFVSR